MKQTRYNMLKGQYVVFEKIQTQNFTIYIINEVMIRFQWLNKQAALRGK